MMIKANGEYLDFDGDIDIESQIKLFEEIETANGDYSYSFDVSKTTNNLKILGFPFPDTVKSIYNNVPCEIIGDDGFLIHTGSLQVNNVTDVISCSFFSGNTEWFGLLDKPMSELPLYKYDVNLTPTTIQASWDYTKGLVFPIIDTGALITRTGFQNLKTEDFTGCFYVKTLMQEIFNPLGINLSGDLIDDSTYNQLIIASNSKSQDDITDRSSYVNKTTQQSTITSLTKITFQDETTFPFYDGNTGNFAASTYTADVKMIVDVDINILINYAAATVKIYIYKNGVSIESYVTGGTLPADSTVSRSLSVPLEAGDTIEVYCNRTSGIGAFTVLINSWIKITPTYIYRVFGKSSVPNWTQAEFVSNILRIFNVIPSYKPESKQLTLNLFNKIREKEPIDVSDDVTIVQTDFSEFVSNYGKNNNFKYQESEDEDLREYNISNFVSYGAGRLTIDNDFIENEADVLESDFTSPITYLNGVFDMSMERINFVELEEIDDKSITSVTDLSGVARLNISNADELFTVNDLVGIETDVDSYNGEWVVVTVASSYIIVQGMAYDSSATGTATLLRHKFTTDDNVYLFVNVTSKNLPFFTSKTIMYIDASDFFVFAGFAYFNLLSNNKPVNKLYKQSLSFGEVNSPLSYQQTILDTYWPIFSQILADPVKLLVEGYFNRNKFTALKSFLRPLRIKTNETNNLYYLNRITGYKSGHEECEAELIKL